MNNTTKGKLSSKKLIDTIIRGIQEKKGKAIMLLDLRKLQTSVSDYFILCTGDTERHVQAITESIEEYVIAKTNHQVLRREGMNNKSWMLLDFFDIIVHVFQKDKREFYRLEELWGDAKISLIKSE